MRVADTRTMGAAVGRTMGIATGRRERAWITQPSESRRGGGEQREQTPRRHTTEQADQQTRVVGEQEQPVLMFDDRFDQVERLGTPPAARVFVVPLVRIFGQCRAGIETDAPRADQSTQVAIPGLVLDEREDASRTVAGVRQLGRDDRAHGRCAGRMHLGLRLGRLDQVDQPRHRVHVRQRQRGHPEVARAFQQGLGRIDSGEQGVMAVAAEGGVHGEAGWSRRNPNGCLTIVHPPRRLS